MKKFCCGDVVPGWLPVLDAPDAMAFQEALSSHLLRDQSSRSAPSAFDDDVRSSLQQANAA